MDNTQKPSERIVIFVVENFDIDSDEAIGRAYDCCDNIAYIQRYADVVVFGLKFGDNNLWIKAARSANDLTLQLGCSVRVIELQRDTTDDYVILKVSGSDHETTNNLINHPNSPCEWTPPLHKDMLVLDRDVVVEPVDVDELSAEVQADIEHALAHPEELLSWDELMQATEAEDTQPS